MNKTYFLDRNVMIKLRQFIEGKKLNERDSEIIEEIKKLDTVENIISPYLSIIEGKKNVNETVSDKLEVIDEECNLINTFCQKAKTDHVLLRQMAAWICETMQGQQEYNFNLCKTFLKQISPLHEIPKARKKDRSKIENKLLETAKNIGLPYTHPVVTLSLAALYGSKEMRNLLHLSKKLNNPKSYNAVSDVYTYLRVCAFEAQAKAFGIKICSQIISYDKNLNVMLKAFKHTGGRITELPKSDILHTSEHTIDACLFPFLTEEEHFEFITELGKKEKARIKTYSKPIWTQRLSPN